MPRLASKQPGGGEIVIYCAHAMSRGGVGSTSSFTAGTHWFDTTTTFTTPDGETGVAQWIVCCEHCYRGLGGDLSKLEHIQVGGHLICGKIAPFIIDDAS